MVTSAFFIYPLAYATVLAFYLTNGAKSRVFVGLSNFRFVLHDPDFRRVRREHLFEVGKRIRLKKNIDALSRMLTAIDGCEFDYYVVSAAPEEVIQSALEGIVDEGHIFGTRFRYDQYSGEIESIVRVPAGYGKVAAHLRTPRYVHADCFAQPSTKAGRELLISTCFEQIPSFQPDLWRYERPWNRYPSNMPMPNVSAGSFADARH